MLSCTIDSNENRYAANIPGAFLDASMEGTVHFLKEGESQS